MNKFDYFKAVLLRQWLLTSERFANILLYSHPFKGLKLEPNVHYGNESEFEVCDLIYPEEHKDKLPIMIYIHGGGWVAGIKNVRRTYCYEFAKDGYFVANIDYDWSPKVQFPVSINQCLKAIDFIFDNAEKNNLDTSRIFLAGESAGAYFVNMLACIAKDKSLLDKIGLTLRHKEFDVKVNLFNCGAIDILSMAQIKFPYMKTYLHCLTDMKVDEIIDPKNLEKVQMMSPNTYITKDFPPTFMLYATHDTLRFDAFKFKEKFDELGIKNELYKCDGPIYGNHAFAIYTKPKQGQKILKVTKNFVNGIIFNI